MAQTRVYDDIIDTPDVRGTWAEPRMGIRHGSADTDPVSLFYLDPWGRPSLVRKCGGTAGDSSASGAVLQAMGCDAAGAIQTLTAYAQDGTLRAQTRPYADGEIAPVSWTWDDSLGRLAVRQDPAPITWPGSTAAADWVQSSWQYDISAVTTTDPAGVSCTRERVDLSGSVACDGVIEASVMVDPLGRLSQQTDGDGRVTRIDRDGFGRPQDIVSEGTVSVYESGSSGSVSDPSWNQAWSSGGRLLSQSDPQGNTVSWSRDAAGRVLSATSTLVDGSSTLVNTWSYDDSGVPAVSMTDINGNTTKT